MNYHDTLNGYTLDEMKRWLHNRLHGCDTLCPPPDPRDGERLYARVSSLYASDEMSDQFKTHVRNAVYDAITTAAEHPEGQWTDGVALDSLLLLAVDVSEGLRRSGFRDGIAQAIRKLVDVLPFERDGVRLKQLAARALLDTRVPPPHPEAYWTQLWEKAAEAGRFFFAGIVFEGLYKHVNLETACEWLATAKPWNPEIMTQAIDNRMRSILADSNPARVTEVLENSLLPLIAGREDRSKMVGVCVKHGLDPWLPIDDEDPMVRFAKMQPIRDKTRTIKRSDCEISLGPSRLVEGLQDLPRVLPDSMRKFQGDKLVYFVADSALAENPEVLEFWKEFVTKEEWNYICNSIRTQTGSIMMKELYPDAG